MTNLEEVSPLHRDVRTPIPRFPRILSEGVFVLPDIISTAEEHPSPPNSSPSSFDCPVCFERLIKPLVAPCGHALCVKCHAKIYTVQPLHARAGCAHPDPVGSKPCPICKRSLTVQQWHRCLLLNMALEALVGHSQNVAVEVKSGEKEIRSLDTLFKLQAQSFKEHLDEAVTIIWETVKKHVVAQTGSMYIFHNDAFPNLLIDKYWTEEDKVDEAAYEEFARLPMARPRVKYVPKPTSGITRDMPFLTESQRTELLMSDIWDSIWREENRTAELLKSYGLQTEFSTMSSLKLLIVRTPLKK